MADPLVPIQYYYVYDEICIEMPPTRTLTAEELQQFASLFLQDFNKFAALAHVPFSAEVVCKDSWETL